jgi:hypothetical protein
MMTEKAREERKHESANSGPACTNGPYLTTAHHTFPYTTFDLISAPHARTTRGVAPAHA